MEKYKNILENLAKELVTPERFGRVALSELLTPTELAQLPLTYRQASGYVEA